MVPLRRWNRCIWPVMEFVRTGLVRLRRVQLVPSIHRTTWSDCNAQWKLELLGRILQFLRNLDGTWRPKRDAQRLY